MPYSDPELGKKRAAEVGRLRRAQRLLMGLCRCGNPQRLTSNNCQKCFDRHKRIVSRMHDRAKYGLRFRSKARNLINDAKSRPCTDCGLIYPAEIMDLDHVRGEKLFNLGTTVNRSLASVIAEIAKCDPRCPTCHRLRHYTDKVVRGS